MVATANLTESALAFLGHGDPNVMSRGSKIGAGREIATSQLALPVEACQAVYATAGYEASIDALARTSFETDGVFADGASRQIATTSGGAAGYTATLEVGIGA